MTMWSELRAARLREVAADATTCAWVALWAALGWNVYRYASQARAVGRALGETGSAFDVAGQRIGEMLARVPIIGPAAGPSVRESLAAAGGPFAAAGADLNRFVLLVAALLGVLVAIMPIAMWLQRYLPWRVRRLVTLRAAQRAVRMAPQLPAPQMERLLAARAFHRLPYEELLRFTPDPFGDWENNRYDGLAQAELASVGLMAVKTRGRTGVAQVRGRKRRS